MIHMEIRCRDCGRIFTVTYRRQLCCPDCVAKHRRTTIATRICRACGVSFSGGPHAWYCPDCRQERHRKAGREYKSRAHLGNARRLGSIDQCTVCGRDYVVNGSLQRYCPDCAPAEYRRKDAEAALAYDNAHNVAQKIRDQYRSARSPIPCAVCGTPFIPNNSSRKCPNCRHKKPEA